MGGRRDGIASCQHAIKAKRQEGTWSSHGMANDTEESTVMSSQETSRKRQIRLSGVETTGTNKLRESVS